MSGLLWQFQIVIGQGSPNRQREISLDIIVTAKANTDDLVHEIITQSRSSLNAFGISVKDVNIFDYYPNYTGNVETAIFENNGRLFIKVRVTRYPFSQISPILTQNYGGQISIEVTPENRSEAIRQASQYVAIMSLYSLGLCAEAAPISSQMMAESEKASSVSLIVDNTDILFFEANCAIEAQDFDKAIPLLEQSKQHSGDSEVSLSWLKVRYYLAWVYIQVGRDEDALNLIKNAVEAASFIPGSGDDYNDALLNSAQLYALMSRYDDAIVNLTIYSDRFGNRIPGIFVLRGQMYLNIYEWGKSLADYNTAIELNPNYAEAYFQRGVLYYSILQTGNSLREEALADFRHYLELASDGPHAEEARRYITGIGAAMVALGDE